MFSFEKLADANSYLGPEMKSTGEVLGIGKDMGEALFKGLVSAGFHLPAPGEEIGALISVDEYDYFEALGLVRKLHNLGCRLYATGGTAAAIAPLGIPVETVADIHDLPATRALLESGRVQLIVYTGALMDATLEDYIALHRQALRLNLACLTSLDTANALADSIASRYTQDNTELVDINHMRLPPPSSLREDAGHGQRLSVLRQLPARLPIPSRCACACAGATTASARTGSC